MSQSGIYGPGGGGGTPITTLAGDSGTASGAVVNVITGYVMGSSINGTSQFIGDNIDTLTLQFNDGGDNVGLGFNSLTAAGPGVGSSQNIALGSYSGLSINGASQGNVLLGHQAGSNLLTGSFNIAIGFTAGNDLLSSESSNIYLNNVGLPTESNILRIGAATGTGNRELANAFISGIQGVNVGSVASVVSISGDQLGSTTITAGSGITVTPGANTITIAAPGAVATTYVGDSGTASPIAGFLDIITGYGTLVASGTIQFTASSNDVRLVLTDATENTILGASTYAGSPGGNSNTGVGNNALGQAGFTGDSNTGMGDSALTSLTTGDNNVGIGDSAGENETTGSNSAYVGYQSGIGAVGASYNAFLGYRTGQNYTSTESSNILINASSTTVLAESNVLRIGNGTGSGNQQLANAYISGINGVNVGSVASVVSISSDHLGSTTITAGTGITVTPGANTITIASTVTTFTWNEITGTSSGMSVNNGYIANNAGLVTLTLPSTAAVGDVVRVTGKGAGGWRIAQNAGETIYFGTSTTTTGVTGRLDSTATRDGIELVCVTANNDWNVLSVQGNISVT